MNRLPSLIAALLAAATIALYWPVGRHPFIQLDDSPYVFANPNVRTGLSWENVRWALTAEHSGNWHPLTWISHMADVELSGLDAGKHHLTSVLLHAANAALLFWVAWGLTGALWPSAFVAALFAWHPLHVESVAWVAERKDVLSTGFWMLTLAAYGRYLRRPGGGRYALVLAVFALGLTAKPMLVTLPLVLLLLDYWPLGRLAGGAGGGDTSHPQHRWWRPLFEKAPLLALSVASSVITVSSQKKGDAVLELALAPISRRVATALVAAATYLVDTVWPARLAIFYPFPTGSWEAWRVVGSALLLAVVTVGAVARMKRFPAVFTGWFWYLGTLVPVIGLVRVGDQSRADRYTYVTLVGVFIALAWGLRALAPRRRALLAGCAVAALIALLPVTRIQIGHWRSGVSLFEHAIAVVPGNWFAYYNLGLELAQAGRQREANAATSRAFALNPQLKADAYCGAAAAYLRAGRTREALEQLQAALRVAPNHRQAGPRLRALLGANPDLYPALVAADLGTFAVGSAEHHYLVGNELGRLGLFEESIASFQEAIRKRPGFAQAHNSLGSSLGNLGRYREAATAYREALRLDPGLAEAQGNLKAVRTLTGD